MTEYNNTLNAETHQETVAEKDQTLEQLLNNEMFFAPSVNIYETKDEFVLTANIPGVSKDGVKLKLEEGVLTIFGKANIYDSLNKKYLLKETRTGNYYRTFKISDSIDESKIEALHENGQLTVKLPKHDRVKPRTINIK
ncbi:MAG: Hsp20/alpha crystallin family protein [Ignavibacteriaceae bacterium]